MFVQVIQGRVNDREGLRRQFDRWQQELAGGATGWLGATAGVSEDGEFVGVVRFESEEAARRNSDRPEQGAWWEETSRYFDGEVTFHDCREVDTMLGGGSDQAGFVQVIQGRVSDPQALRARREEFEEALRRARPDVLGGTVAWHGDDGAFTQVVYFTDEAEARKGEQQERSPEDQARFEEMRALMSDLKFVDLRQPWLSSSATSS